MPRHLTKEDGEREGRLMELVGTLLESNRKNEDIALAYKFGFTQDQWGRWCMPGEWRLPPQYDEGTRGMDCSGLSEVEVRERFELAHRLDNQG